MKTFNTIINEMFVHNKSSLDKNQNTKIFAYKKDIWIIDEKSKTSLKKTLSEINKTLNMNFDSFDRLEGWLYDGSTECIIGYVQNNTLTVQKTSTYSAGANSPIVKKVIKTLKLTEFSRVSYDGDDNEIKIDTPIADMMKDLGKQKFYHGTSMAYLDGIMKTGLRPHSENTSFGSIIHKDKIFVTTNKSKALYHAENSGANSRTMPIILEIDIPNPDRLVSDYDVVIQLIGYDTKIAALLGYDEVLKNSGGYQRHVSLDHEHFIKYSKKLGGLSSKLGIFGYKGNIMPKFITGIITDTNTVWSIINSAEMDHDDMNMEDETETKFEMDIDILNDLYQEYEYDYTEYANWNQISTKRFLNDIIT